MIENKRYPHIKRGWIKAIKAIRNGGGIQKRIYPVEHPQRLDPLRNVRGLLRTQAATSIIQTQDIGRGGYYRKPKPKICHRKELAQNAISIPTKRIFGEPQRTTWRQNRGIWKLAETGVFRWLLFWPLDRGARNEIAENIYDWWISGKPYKKWYAEKFQQLKLDLGEF